MYIRPATDGDVPALTRLINSAFVVEQVAFDGDRVDEKRVCGYMRSGRFLVAENAGRLVGCVYIERHGERSYLGLLCVDPPRQGIGLGRRLAAAAEEHARALGSRVMDLRVISPRAEKLLPYYERLGYKFVRTQPFPPDLATKVPAYYILMSKPLI